MPQTVTKGDLSLEDYKKFFDDTPVALIRTDIKTGEFLMANKFAAKLFGFESVEHLQQNAATIDLYSPEDRKKLIKILKKQGSVEDYEIRLELPSKILWVSARLHINCGGSCIEGSLIDITELVKLRNSQLSVLQEVGKKIDKKIAALAG